MKHVTIGGEARDYETRTCGQSISHSKVQAERYCLGDIIMKRKQAESSIWPSARAHLQSHYHAPSDQIQRDIGSDRIGSDQMTPGLGMPLPIHLHLQPSRWSLRLGHASFSGPVRPLRRPLRLRCANAGEHAPRTCKNCKSQFDPSLNHPSACRFHTAHFGGETKRKFESVYTGGTLSTPDSGKVYQYWHCCGSEDPFHPGCTSAPHASYDD